MALKNENRKGQKAQIAPGPFLRYIRSMYKKPKNAKIMPAFNTLR